MKKSIDTGTIVETDGELFGCRTGDRIICMCKAVPECPMSDPGMEPVVEGFVFEDNEMWVSRKNENGKGRVYRFCSDHSGATIKIIKKRSEKK